MGLLALTPISLARKQYPGHLLLSLRSCYRRALDGYLALAAMLEEEIAHVKKRSKN